MSSGSTCSTFCCSILLTLHRLHPPPSTTLHFVSPDFDSYIAVLRLTPGITFLFFITLIIESGGVESVEGVER